MDKVLEGIIQLASKRKSRYKKGNVPIEKVSDKIAELGIFLITSSKRISALKGERLKVKFAEVQDKVDDFRKVLYQIRETL
ncbi:MAG: hypothetical protein AB1610_07315 [Nitrospirota bacterium]